VDNSQQKGMKKRQIGGCNSGPTGHDFPHNSNIYFFYKKITMRTGSFSKCEHQSGSHIECQVRTCAVLTSNESLQSGSHDGSKRLFSLSGSHDGSKRLFSLSGSHDDSKRLFSLSGSHDGSERLFPLSGST
jgi:hypothetical protein